MEESFDDANEAGEESRWSWFSGMTRQAQIVMVFLVVLVVFFGGLLIGSSGDGGPVAVDDSSVSTFTTSDPTTAVTTVPTMATVAATATLSPPISTTSITTAPTSTTTTAAPATTTTTTAAPTTTSTTIPFVLIVEDFTVVEQGYGVDLDTGTIYTFPTNPDLVNPVLAAAVDVIFNEVLVGATGFNVVVSPFNSALVVRKPADQDSCLETDGPFEANKVFVNRTGEEFDGYFCFQTTEGNLAIMAPVVVSGTQDPVSFGFFTVEPPGYPGS